MLTEPLNLKEFHYVEKSDFMGKVKVVTGRRGVIGIYDENNRQIKKYDVPYGAELVVNDGQSVKKRQSSLQS